MGLPGFLLVSEIHNLWELMMSEIVEPGKEISPPAQL